MTRHHIDRAGVFAVCADASADPRSVARVLNGERVRGMVDGRIRRALAARGIVAPEPSDAERALGARPGSPNRTPMAVSHVAPLRAGVGSRR